MSPRRHHRSRLLLTLLVSALAAAAIFPLLGPILVVADPLVPAAAVVPLGGDLGQRVAFAARLLSAGYAPRLIVTDMVRTPDGALASREQAAQALAAGVAPARLISTERVVNSTYSELSAIRDLALAHGFRSLIVVTSPQHTRRTRIQADELFRDSGIRVIVRPVVGYGYNPAQWWRDPHERRLTLTEYLKLFVYLFGYR